MQEKKTKATRAVTEVLLALDEGKAFVVGRSIARDWKEGDVKVAGVVEKSYQTEVLDPSSYIVGEVLIRKDGSNEFCKLGKPIMYSDELSKDEVKKAKSRMIRRMIGKILWLVTLGPIRDLIKREVRRHITQEVLFLRREETQTGEGEEE